MMQQAWSTLIIIILLIGLEIVFALSWLTKNTVIVIVVICRKRLVFRHLVDLVSHCV